MGHSPPNARSPKPRLTAHGCDRGLCAETNRSEPGPSSGSPQPSRARADRRPLSARMNRRLITVNDKMQRGYTYELHEPTGKNFDEGFEPELSPKEMLELGVFGGK